MNDIADSQVPPRARGTADIVFLMDVSGSMQSVIEDLKNNINCFIDELDRGANGILLKHWRAKVVGYRDFIWDKDKIEDNPFVETADELRSQLDKLEAKGGGDEPESLLEGIMHVAGMEETEKGLPDSDLDPNKWRYRGDAARMVIIFTDASYHETMEEPYEGGDFMDVANICMDKRIILQVFCPEMECYDQIREIDKSEVFQIPYDKDDEEGAVKALRDFTGDKKNFYETLYALGGRTVSIAMEMDEI